MGPQGIGMERQVESTTVEREGLLNYSWEARGVLRRPMHLGRMVILPGGMTLVGEGTALTRRGAMRKGRRALRRWT